MSQKTESGSHVDDDDSRTDVSQKVTIAKPGFRTPPTSSMSTLALDKYAVRIQRLWRSYIDLQVFKYYKSMVMFHNQGDPALLMSYINPNEAQLIDAASGIHIKFRLAGSQFPPNIVYKIYTHRPVQDLCANAPRDYTKLRKRPALVANNKEAELISYKSTEMESEESSWYRRVENNGWRPVCSKHLVQMNMDYYYGRHVNLKSIHFSHSKDVAKRRKEKKIEWMKKMYQSGMLTHISKKDNPYIAQVADSLIDRYDSQGSSNSIEDWEVDKLLEWTNALSFSDYVYEWKTVGTTAPSDKRT